MATGNPWERLQTAVASELKAIEAKTHAEIVPIVVARSSTVRHVFPFLFVAFWLGLELVEFQWRLVSPAISLVLGFLLSRLDVVQRLFVPFRDQLEQVNRRAEFEWLEGGFEGTRSRAGVMLFVSVLEHRVVIVADRSVQERLNGEAPWEEVCSQMLKTIRKEGIDEGILTGVRLLGAILERVHPRGPEHDPAPNELKNALIVKE